MEIVDLILVKNQKMETLQKMIEKLTFKDLMDLLTIQAQADLGDWISANFLDETKDFVVVLCLSEDILDPALYCVCSMDLSADEPKIHIRHALVSNKVPPEAEGLESFELGSCDMEMS